jgi:hypothetical protein
MELVLRLLRDGLHTCAEVLNAYAAQPTITAIADVPGQIPS